MEIFLNKNNNMNINKQSRKFLNDFQKKQLKSNIKYHKIFLIFTILINIGLISFIFFYKLKIIKIKNLSSKINNQDKKLKISQKLLNIAALNKNGVLRLSFVFEKSEEFNTVKKLIYDYKIKMGDNIFELESRVIF